MKMHKRVFSSIMSIAMLASIGAAGANGVFNNSNLTASATTISQLNFNSKVAAEKVKYPEFVNGKQCYWNHGKVDGYTTEPCQHNPETAIGQCNFIDPVLVLFNKDYSVIPQTVYNNRTQGNLKYGQCAGFGQKIAKDIMGTQYFARHELIDSNGNYYVNNGKGGQTKMQYTPKQGDIVRLYDDDKGHTIFVTGVNTSTGQVTFAQCNGDNKCGIQWDETKYNGVHVSAPTSITISYLRKYTVYFDRVAFCGDLNFDDKVNSTDELIFNNTLAASGKKLGVLLKSYDANNDGRVDKSDITAMHNGVAAPHILTEADVTCAWNVCPDNAECVGGYFYEINKTGGVSFEGVLDASKYDVNVPDTVYMPSANKSYSVTEIGKDAIYPPASNSNPMKKIQYISVPSTVKKVNRFAFMGSSLITFEERVHSTTNKSCDLTAIGENAFYDIKSLKYVEIPSSYAPLEIGNSSNGAFYGKYTPTIELDLENNSTKARALYLHGNDVVNFKSGKLRIRAGKYSIYDDNNKLIGQNTDKTSKYITPIK